jgi:hypothetical protein
MSEEYKGLIERYGGEHDLNGYSFEDFMALREEFLREFVGKANFKHRGAFQRIHADGNPGLF